MMEKITEKAKTLEEYDKVIEDFRQVMRDWATTRYVYLTASETMDENTQTFKDTVQNTNRKYWWQTPRRHLLPEADRRLPLSRQR